MKKYRFQGIRWVPGYNDFDWDDYEIEANSEAEAWTKLDKVSKYWKAVIITHIDGINVDPASETV